MDTLFSMTELYDVVLKANSPTSLFGKTFEEGEVVMAFDRISVALIEPRSQTVSAKGGEGNHPQVLWDTVSEVYLTFAQGVFSMNQLSLMGNARQKQQIPIRITRKENQRTDDNRILTLSKIPSGKIFIYDLDGNKTEFTRLGDRSIELDTSGKWYSIHYEVDAQATQLISIGAESGIGFMTLEGKTRVKGEQDGKDRLGIFHFPKVQLMSSLSIRLNNDFPSPVVGTFMVNVLPVGSRKNKTFYEFILLRDED